MLAWWLLCYLKWVGVVKGVVWSSIANPISCFWLFFCLENVQLFGLLRFVIFARLIVYSWLRNTNHIVEETVERVRAVDSASPRFICLCFNAALLQDKQLDGIRIKSASCLVRRNQPCSANKFAILFTLLCFSVWEYCNFF